MQRYFLNQTIHDQIILTDDQDIFQHFGKVMRARVGTQAEFVSQDQQVMIGEVIAMSAHTDLDNQVAAPLHPQLFYQNQAVTQTNPAPFTTLPPLTGYQHFTG